MIRRNILAITDLYIGNKNKIDKRRRKLYPEYLIHILATIETNRRFETSIAFLMNKWKKKNSPFKEKKKQESALKKTSITERKREEENNNPPSKM